jgi:hypothetical protein
MSAFGYNGRAAVLVDPFATTEANICDTASLGFLVLNVVVAVGARSSTGVRRDDISSCVAAVFVMNAAFALYCFSRILWNTGVARGLRTRVCGGCHKFGGGHTEPDANQSLL